MAVTMKIFCIGRYFPIGKIIYHSCHATWLLCKTSTLQRTLKEQQTQLCCKYIRKISQNDHPINFLIPKTATSSHSYNLRQSDNNGNIVYADRNCCRTEHSGSIISFDSKYVDM